MSDKYGLMVTVTIGFFLALILSAFLYWDYSKDTKMASLGYQKTTVMGTSIAQWQKAKKD